MAPNRPSPHPSVEFEVVCKYRAILSNGSLAFALLSSNFEPHVINSPHITATFGSVSYLQRTIFVIEMEFPSDSRRCLLRDVVFQLFENALEEGYFGATVRLLFQIVNDENVQTQQIIAID